MIFLSDKNGRIIASIPDQINSGSIGVTEIILVAPFPASTAIAAAFTLPNGTKLLPNFMGESLEDNDAFVMTLESNFSQKLMFDSDNVNIWRIQLDAAITQIPGSVKIGFIFVGSDGAKKSSVTSFPVNRSQAYIEPDIPTNYVDVLRDINTALTSAQNLEKFTKEYEESARRSAEASESAKSLAESAQANAESAAASAESNASTATAAATTATAAAETAEAAKSSAEQSATSAEEAAESAKANAETTSSDKITITELYNRFQSDLDTFVYIDKVEQTTTSTEDDGENIVTITLSNGQTVDVVIQNGSKGSTGEGFKITKTYKSIAEMNASYYTDGVPLNSFVLIDTGNVEDADNAKLFIKGAQEYVYLTDLSGATGIKGEDGKDGKDGKDGINGKSAYEIAVSNGFKGTEKEWLRSLYGEWDYIITDAASLIDLLDRPQEYRGTVLVKGVHADIGDSNRTESELTNITYLKFIDSSLSASHYIDIKGNQNCTIDGLYWSCEFDSLTLTNFGKVINCKQDKEGVSDYPLELIGCNNISNSDFSRATGCNNITDCNLTITAYSAVLVNCTHIHGLTLDQQDDNAAQIRKCIFDNCRYMSNINPLDGTISTLNIIYNENCRYIDPDTCAGFLKGRLPDAEKAYVQALTEDGSFRAISPAEEGGGEAVSPTISVSEITGGHRLTITDINGEKTVDVMNGKDGVSVTVSKVTESSASGGANVVTFSDGNTLNVKNGKDGTNGKDGKDANSYTVPDYWQNAVKAAIASVQSLQNASGSKCVCFGLCSDMHVHYPYPTDNNYAQNIGHISAAVMDKCDIPLFLNCGDVLTNTVYTDVSYILKAYEQAWSYLDVIGDERLMLVAGNHDGAWGVRASDSKNYANNINPNELYQYLYRPQAKDFRRVWGDSGKYFYIDNLPQKTRFICLNSHDGVWSENADGSAVWNTMTGGYTQDQLNWLANIALNVEEGWTIVIASHVPPTAKLPNNYSSIRGYNVIRGIVTAYAKRTTYTGTYTYNTSNGEGAWANISISVDFTENAKGTIAGWFCGHCHKDAIVTGDLPFPIVTVTCAGNFSYDATNEGTRTLGTSTETAVDFVCINTEEKNIDIVRLGIGVDSDGIRSVVYALDYTVTNNLTNVTSSNVSTGAREGKPYTATLTPSVGIIETVTVTMGGVDITSSVYSNGVINIPSVTGDIVITAEAVSTDPFALVASNWTFKGGSSNPFTINSNSISFKKETGNAAWVICNHEFARKNGTYSFSCTANGTTANGYVMVIVQAFDANGNELTDKSVYVPNHSYAYNSVFGGFAMNTAYASFTFTVTEAVSTFKVKFAPGGSIAVDSTFTLSNISLVEP